MKTSKKACSLSYKELKPLFLFACKNVHLLNYVLCEFLKHFINTKCFIKFYFYYTLKLLSGFQISEREQFKLYFFNTILQIHKKKQNKLSFRVQLSSCKRCKLFNDDYLL